MDKKMGLSLRRDEIRIRSFSVGVDKRGRDMAEQLYHPMAMLSVIYPLRPHMCAEWIN